ncbi:DUF6346 domain-containing protein [Amycolatopsis sp. cmx-11-12]|uniref:DUF6346 domain-containing protein n=1 Tax=Amycolatopsis sp. cmx-11-12 TaxID=2785795 RepID=UPI0039173308
MRSAGKTAVTCAAAWVLLVLFLLGVVTLFRLSGVPATTTDSDSADADATAFVAECAERGPVSLKGAGFYWECTAEVQVNPERQARLIEFGPDELTPGDRERPIFVKYANGDWQRNTAHPYVFLRVVGPIAVGGLAFLIYAIGIRSIAGWFVPSFTRSKKPAHPTVVSRELPLDLAFPVPDGGDPKGVFAAFTFLTVLGTGLLVMAGTMIVAVFRLMPDNWAAYLVALPFGLLGGSVLVAIPSARRRMKVAQGASVIPARLTVRGFQQTARDGSPKQLHWSKIKKFVFEERPGDLVEVHLSVFNDDVVADLAEPFRARSRHGYLLSPYVPLHEAEHLSTVVENFKPGLTSWPTREITRGGLGLIGPVKSTVVRLRRKAGATVHVDTRVSSSRPSVLRVLLMLTTCALVIWSLSIGASGGTSVNLFVISALMVVYLAVSLYRGRRGTFVVRQNSLVWRETGKNEVLVDLASINGIVVKPVTSGNGRWYYSLHVKPREGDEYQLVDKVGRAAAKRVLRAAERAVVLQG